jgi:hypothetical protein
MVIAHAPSALHHTAALRILQTAFVLARFLGSEPASPLFLHAKQPVSDRLRQSAASPPDLVAPVSYSSVPSPPSRWCLAALCAHTVRLPLIVTLWFPHIVAIPAKRCKPFLRPSRRSGEISGSATHLVWRPRQPMLPAISPQDVFSQSRTTPALQHSTAMQLTTPARY